MSSPAFDCYNLAPPARPVLLSVAHAGRDYPPSSALRIPPRNLTALEDRHADLLATRAIDDGTGALIARTPRLWIDLNRGEDEFDPAMTGDPPSAPLPTRVRGGLGLIPRRIGVGGEIWRLPLARDDVTVRIEAVHRPFHATLAAALAMARSRFGTAVLIDLHSMPPLPGPDAPAVVLGDRFGSSCSPALSSLAEAVLGASGLRVAVNTPYAGGHIAQRHAAPAHGIHVMQLEIDRARYLDAALDGPGPGLTAMQGLVARLIDALCNEIAPAQAIAAE